MVGEEDIHDGLQTAIENVQESVHRSYYNAVSSPRNNSIHREVLLACALAEPDDFGYFSAVDIREQLSSLLNKPVEVARYLRYLGDFASYARGNVLQREGTPWRQRYRFANPMVETFVILKGFDDGLLEADGLTS